MCLTVIDTFKQRRGAVACGTVDIALPCQSLPVARCLWQSQVRSSVLPRSPTSGWCRRVKRMHHPFYLVPAQPQVRHLHSPQGTTLSTNVIITFKAKPEKLTAFREILGGVKTDLPKVDGCIAVSVFNDTQDACVFTLVETWQSQAAHQKHIEGVVSSGGWSHIASHLSCDPSSSYFTTL